MLGRRLGVPRSVSRRLSAGMGTSDVLACELASLLRAPAAPAAEPAASGSAGLLGALRAAAAAAAAEGVGWSVRCVGRLRRMPSGGGCVCDGAGAAGATPAEGPGGDGADISGAVDSRAFVGKRRGAPGPADAVTKGGTGQ
jgi:hypothetical protein